MNKPLKFLAFETSTEMLSVALGDASQTWHHQGVGGANASAQLIPVIHDLLAKAQWQWPDLTALIVGKGPGSFTGLRTACSVAQGLALGAHLTVIPVDTLLAVAEDARWQKYESVGQKAENFSVGVVMDARMGEVYMGAYTWSLEARSWQTVLAPQVGAPEKMAQLLRGLSLPKLMLAGNGFEVSKDCFPLQVFHTEQGPVRCEPAMPNALALLRLAPALWMTGQAVAPELVQPLYIRDKVAQTTLEREALQLAKAAAVFKKGV